MSTLEGENSLPQGIFPVARLDIDRRGKEVRVQGSAPCGFQAAVAFEESGNFWNACPGAQIREYKRKIAAHSS
jgi:hypothetical protein